MRSPIPTSLLLAAVGACCASALAGNPQFKGGNVFFASRGNAQVCEFTSTGVFVAAHASGSTEVFDVEFGPDGLLYVPKHADANSSARIRSFRADGALMQEIPLTGTPVGIAVGPGGRMYVAEYFEHRVDVVGASGAVESVLALGAQFPRGVAFTPRGTIAVPYEGSGVVVFFDPAGFGVDLRTVNAPKRMTLLSDGASYVSDGAGLLKFFDRFGVSIPSEDVAGPFGAPIFDAAIQPDYSPLIVLPTASSGLDMNWTSATIPFVDVALANPTAVAVCPYRFKATVKGTLTQLGGKSRTVSQSATLSVLPGSNRVMLAFAPNTKLGKAFLGQSFVAYGVEDGGVFPDRRAIHAMQRPDASLLFATVSIDLRLIDAKNAAGEFVRVKSATGSLHASNAFATFVGSIKSGKALN
jgi:hypothetical protein